MNNENYWAVGFKIEDSDKSQCFIEQSIWECGNPDTYAKALQSIKEDDYIILKSSFTRGSGKSKSSCTRIKAIGRVISPFDKSSKSLRVEWFKVFEPGEELVGTWLSKTISRINNLDIKKRLTELMQGNSTQKKESEAPPSLQYSDWVYLVKKSHNLILTGAPGTGKTRLAKEIANVLASGNDNQTDFVQFHPSYDYTDFVGGLRPIQKDGALGFEYQKGIFWQFCDRAKAQADNDFVFIIDEINRGDIARIFGELFYALDPGYRGVDGGISTQYTNLLAENEKFFIPENVYIIGTMNDIDRSVESFDFAIRRRFTWKEVTVEDSMANMKIEGEAKQRMQSLNKAIEDKLGTSFQVGGAYFRKNKDDEAYNFEELWDYRLKPLLTEYVRGHKNSKDLLDTFEKAYNTITK